jgi:RNA polymerase sigma-70 factor (ECF subfamily)
MHVHSAPSPVLSDEDAARRFLAGDADAFAVLVDRYSTPLYRYARRLTGNDDADDLVQETFVRLYQNLPRLKLDEPLKPWLYHVCTNLCRSLARRHASIPFSALENADEEDGGIVERLASDEEGAADRLDRSMDAQRVHAAIERLPAKYRIILTLFYFDHLSYDDIAASLDLPLNTVRTHLHRAKAELLDILKHDHAA